MNAEVAGVLGAFSLQHETFVFFTNGALDHKFFSSYIQGSWCLNESHRTYDRQCGTFNGIVMAPDSWYGYGGSGKWEIAARFSYADLDDKSISGGKLTDITLGLNWYLNTAARVMVNSIHADREDVGISKILATRFQVKF